MAHGDSAHGSAHRRGRVAFIDLYRQWPSYFLDTFTALEAEGLRREGYEVAWLKAFILDDDEGVLEALESRLRSHDDWDFIVLERVWSRSLLARLVRASAGAKVVVSPWRPPDAWREVDYRISPPRRGALSDLLRQSMASQPIEGSNIYHRATSGDWIAPKESRPLAIGEYFQAPLRYAYDLVETFGVPADQVRQTRYLMLNMGCPYRGAQNATGFLDGLALPTPWGASGCTFCNVGPYEAQSAGDRRALIDHQLEALAAHGDYERLVVIDEFIFRDIDELAHALVRRGPRHLEVLVRARVDYLETYDVQLSKALATLEGHASLTPYLVGFENFSDDELERYNKGQSAAQTLEGAKRLIALAERWPNLNLSPSQGFILFGPWTTLRDLKLNAEALAQIDARALRGGITRSKLRLNPDAALIAKARADGLLLHTHLEANQDNAAETGYQAEVPYRFLDPQTEQVWRLLNGERSVQGRSELARLDAAIAMVEMGLDT